MLFLIATYTTVFDIDQSGYRNWWFPASGLIFVVVGLVLPTLIKLGIFSNGGRFKGWFPQVFTSFAVIWTVVAFVGTFSSYMSSRDALDSGRALIVEGPVQDFHPMPKEGHSMESFTVNGVKFSYSDFAATPGFNQTTSHGGPIFEGLHVKIWYKDGTILKLQIQN